MGYDDFEGGGVTLFPYYDLEGGCGKFPTKITSSIGWATIFFLKKKRKWKYAVGHSYNSCLLFHFDKMLIQNYSMKLDEWRPLPVLQGLFASGSNSFSTPSSLSLSSLRVSPKTVSSPSSSSSSFLSANHSISFSQECPK